MSQKLLEVFVFSIPEGIILFYLASSFRKKMLSMSNLALMGIIFGTIIYLIRLIAGNYIISILFSCILAIFLLKIIGKYELFDAAIGGLMAVSIYLAVEFLNIKVLQTLTGIDPIALGKDFKLRITWFIPQILADLGISLVIRGFVSR